MQQIKTMYVRVKLLYPNHAVNTESLNWAVQEFLKAQMMKESDSSDIKVYHDFLGREENRVIGYGRKRKTPIVSAKIADRKVVQVGLRNPQRVNIVLHVDADYIDQCICGVNSILIPVLSTEPVRGEGEKPFVNSVLGMHLIIDTYGASDVAIERRCFEVVDYPETDEYEYEKEDEEDEE